ncbi:MAG TPA: hypothetical protein VG841_07615 [Caulobacterales bacterium]|nr:hypothetical protein [Caulobacterales bacterium]
MRFKTGLLSALLGLTLAAGAAWAEPHGRGRHQGGGQQPVAVEPNWSSPRAEVRDRDRQQERILSVREVAERVRDRFGGELISASLQGRTYLLRWRFPNERVEDIRVDAVSGAIYR